MTLKWPVPRTNRASSPEPHWAPALVSKELPTALDLALVVNQRRSAPKFWVPYIQSLACLMCLILGYKIGELSLGAIGSGIPLWRSAVDRQGYP